MSLKKEITIAAITLLLTATPAFAQSSHATSNDRGNSDQNHSNQDIRSIKGIQIKNNTVIRSSEPDRDEITIVPTNIPSASPSVTPIISPSIIPCNPDDNWRNHGAYVSCIAHLHRGEEEVSEAAHSEIGEKHHFTPTPSTNPSLSPIPSVSPTPIASVSPTPLTTAMGTVDEGESPINNIGAIFHRFVAFLSHWI